MRVVIVGKGGREHALADRLSQDAEVVVTPGSAGIPGSVDTPPEQLEADLFIIGSENDIVDGLADRLRAQGKNVLAPGADGAQLEGSKAWMKDVLVKAGVPTAHYREFRPDQVEAAVDYLRHTLGPWVIKTDYLAAGKGVLVTGNLEEAIIDAETKLQDGTIIIEACLRGREVSFFALCFGKNGVLMAFAQDYKKLYDGDRGPNTGGMGSYSPVLGTPSPEVIEDIVRSTLTELGIRKISYTGFLYGGLMLTPDPFMLEYNIRLGDPEAQVVLPRLTGDLAMVFRNAAVGNRPTIEISSDACVCVVLASEGYGSPDGPVLGDIITGIEAADVLPGITVLHSGTKLNDDGEYVTNGGRVLSVVARGKTVPEARARAYQAVHLIRFRGMHYRSDIATGVEVPANPQSMRAFLALCRQHQDLIVTREDSLNADNCERYTNRFICAYLGGRKQVPLGQLIKFIRDGHDYWDFVILAISEAMMRVGILSRDWSYDEAGLREPKGRRNVVLQNVEVPEDF